MTNDAFAEGVHTWAKSVIGDPRLWLLRDVQKHLARASESLADYVELLEQERSEKGKTVRADMGTQEVVKPPKPASLSGTGTSG
jgi:hypothetical protein